MGTVLNEELISGYVGLNENIKRAKYENYISVNGPKSNDENIVIATKDEDLKNVNGIGNAKFESLKEYICI